MGREPEPDRAPSLSPKEETAVAAPPSSVSGSAPGEGQNPGTFYAASMRTNRGPRPATSVRTSTCPSLAVGTGKSSVESRRRTVRPHRGLSAKARLKLPITAREDPQLPELGCVRSSYR